MNNSIVTEIKFKNEPVLEYKEGPERIELEAQLAQMKTPMWIFP